MKLSQYVLENENCWHQEAEAIIKQFLDIMGSKLKVNLYEYYHIDDSVLLYQKIYVALFANYKKAFYETLSILNIDIAEFENALLFSVILSIIKNVNNKQVLIDLLKSEGIITLFDEGEKIYSIESSKYGNFSFKRASDYYKDEKTQKIFDQKNLDDGCHEYSLEFLKIFPNFLAVTGIVEPPLRSNYYHSIIVNDEQVIDVANNLVLPKDIYFALNKVQILNEVNYEEYIACKDENVGDDESKTLYDLLRIAVYKEQIENLEMKEGLT